MRDRKKRNITIISLCCLLVFMAVGYAILSQQLNIDGTANMTGIWDIEILSTTETSTSVNAETISTEVSTEGDSASFTVDFKMPGDYAEYDVVVKNKGNINAALQEIAISEDPTNDYVQLTHNAKQGKILEAGTEMTFKVKMKFLESATDTYNGQTLTRTMSLIFVQYASSTEEAPIDYENDNACFTVAADGELIDYDYAKCGSTMTVPESVDGINITRIDDTFFEGEKYNEYIASLGYIRYKFVYVNSTMGVYGYSIFNTEEDKQAYLTANNLDEKAMLENGYIYIVHSFDDLENFRFMHPDFIYLVNSSGETWGEGANCKIYTYFDMNGTGYVLAETDSCIEPARLFAESYGINQNNVFLVGDSNIPIDYYYTLEEDKVNGDLVYTHFYDITNAEEVNLYSKKIIETMDLSNASYLTEIGFQYVEVNELYLPTSLRKISANAFRQGSHFTYLEIPNSVTEIGEYAFFGMSNTSKIVVRRPNEVGMTLGASWSGDATVVYEP